MNLTELYNLKLEIYKETGIKEHPSKLLAMLLLPEMDKYEPLNSGEGLFYRIYKKEIDKKINKVENDFNITKAEIISYIEETIISEEKNYNDDKIWFVFNEGFGAMHWGLMYRKNNTPEQTYIEYFDDIELLEINNSKILVKTKS